MPFSPNARRQWEAGHRQNAIATLEAYKLDHGCVDCGYREHPAALHFDHRDPATKRADLGWVPDRSHLHTATRLRRFLRTAAEGHYTLGQAAPARPPAPALF